MFILQINIFNIYNFLTETSFRIQAHAYISVMFRARSDVRVSYVPTRCYLGAGFVEE